LITGLLSLGGLIAYVDRSSLSVALALPSFKETFHLTDSDRGWLSSAFFLSYARGIADHWDLRDLSMASASRSMSS
jgi:hypothetical protein